MTRRRLLSSALGLALALVAAACDRTVIVDASADGSEKLPLAGEPSVTGTTERALRAAGVEVPAGTKVRVEETWLVRKEKGKQPPSYRLFGYYDPTTRTDGLMLPRHAVDTYYYSAVLPESRVRIAVPARHFLRDGAAPR